jgi:hypothetical protein
LLADFIYSQPTWLIAVLVIGIWTGLSLLGLYVFNRMVDVNLRHRDTETVGLTYNTVAVVYAVLLALIAVDVFETFSRADDIVSAESNKLSNLMLDASGLSPQLASQVRSDLNKYIDIAVKSEWPSQQAGKLGGEVFMPGWTVLAHISDELAVFEPASMGQNVDKAEMMHALNDLIKARRSRIIRGTFAVSDLEDAAVGWGGRGGLHVLLWSEKLRNPPGGYGTDCRHHFVGFRADHDAGLSVPRRREREQRRVPQCPTECRGVAGGGAAALIRSVEGKQAC